MATFLNRLFRGIEILMAILLALMILFVFTNVIMRYVFSTGLAWSEEVARLCFIYLVYLGTIGAFRDNRHLGVETILEKVPPIAQKAMYVLVQAIIIWMMVLLAAGSWDLAMQSANDRWVATQFPRSLVNGIGVVTGGAIVLIALANLYRLFIMRLSVPELIAVRDEDQDDPERPTID